MEIAAAITIRRHMRRYNAAESSPLPHWLAGIKPLSTGLFTIC